MRFDFDDCPTFLAARERGRDRWEPREPQYLSLVRIIAVLVFAAAMWLPLYTLIRLAFGGW